MKPTLIPVDVDEKNKILQSFNTFCQLFFESCWDDPSASPAGGSENLQKIRPRQAFAILAQLRMAISFEVG